MSTIGRRARNLTHAVAQLGLKGAALYYRGKYTSRGAATPPLPLRSRSADHTLHFRPGTSDINVFRQIFIEREYGALDDIDTRDGSFIVDCGANVGYSSAYFLSRFPSCVLLAVEPDPDNFSLLQRNLAPFGARTRIVQAGVWSHSGGLMMTDAPFRDGGTWSQQVRSCEPGETPTVEAISITTLLATSGFSRISVLKIDIEGAECEVFARNYETWIDRVDTIVIELHDDSHFGLASSIFFAAIDGRGFQTPRRSGELVICTRPRPPSESLSHSSREPYRTRTFG